jgi:hypothetical protein
MLCATNNKAFQQACDACVHVAVDSGGGWHAFVCLSPF